jgi:hypothetical protein
MARLIDEALPVWDVNEVHDTWVRASPAEAYSAARAVTVGEVRLLRPFMAVRLIPALVQGRRGIRDDSAKPVLDAMVASGFSVLGERVPEEIALGVVGQFWKLSAESSLRPVADVHELAAFAEPGYARSAMDFRFQAEGPGTRITTETRVAGTDAEATRAFRRYWRVIGTGSALIRISWLNAIRRRVDG